MTREELYKLVWSSPMTHLAKEFGISDIAIRKHCKKYDIATPYVGYWAKLEHGKRVLKPQLSTKKFSANVSVDITPKIRPADPVEASLAAKETMKRLELLRSQFVVPDRLSGQPHPLIRHTKERLKQAKSDNHGLLNIGNSYHPSISVGPESIQRVLCILSTIRKVAETQGQTLFEKDSKYYWNVKDETFAFRIYETKTKNPHEPTRAELSEQARQDKWRNEHPDWYSSNRKTYRTWDYYPSGRLTFELGDSRSYGWRDKHIEHRWRDKKSKPLESCLAEIFIWLASAEVLIREQRLEHEEERRVQAVAAEQRQITKERGEKAKKLERFILELADTQKTIKCLSELLRLMRDSPNENSWATCRLSEEIQHLQTQFQSKTDEGEIAAFLNSLKLNQDSPLIIPYLTIRNTDNDFS